MRLLNRHTLKLEVFNEKSTRPPYAIASHRWTKHEVDIKNLQKLREDVLQVFRSLRNGDGRLPDWFKGGFLKIRLLLRAVELLMPSIGWIWIDTCCIDKTNSTELTEALNSMFKWYQEAEVCLAYLNDVGADKDEFSESEDSSDSDTLGAIASFGHSEWFRRGWTLQELLAPDTVVFLDRRGRPIGHKKGVHTESPSKRWNREPYSSELVQGPVLNSVISKITGIDESILHDFSNAANVSVEEKRRWMKNRKTTRIEDMVYCQLGIFGVFMPLIYGEGENALQRLEEEIEKKQQREHRQREHDLKRQRRTIEPKETVDRAFDEQFERAWREMQK